MRRALLPLATMADETGACVLVVRHTKKGGGKAIMAGAGSLGGILGIARGAMVLNADPDDRNRRVLAVSKSNLAALPDSLSVEIVNGPIGPHVQWCGTSPHDADALTEGSSDDERSSLDEASEWLADALHGGAKEKADLVRTARTEGITTRTLERAKQRLGVKHRREGYGKGFLWELPSQTPLSRQLANPANLGDVGEQHGEYVQTDSFGDGHATATVARQVPRQESQAWRVGEVGEIGAAFAADPHGELPVPF